MAKRPQLKITQRTTEEPQTTPGAGTPAGDELPATGKTQPVGIGLKESEHEALDEIAVATGIAKNSLARWAIRDFIKRYRRGEIDFTGKIDEPPHPKNAYVWIDRTLPDT